MIILTSHMHASITSHSVTNKMVTAGCSDVHGENFLFDTATGVVAAVGTGEPPLRSSRCALTWTRYDPAADYEVLHGAFSCSFWNST